MIFPSSFFAKRYPLLIILSGLSASSFVDSFSKAIRADDGILEVEYGEYPQTLVDSKTQNKLEKIYLLEQLKKEEYRTKMKKTGKVYTFDRLPASPVNFNKPIRPICYDELVYNNQKYIRLWENCDRYLWIKVEPIIWLIDEKTGLLISKKILLSGIRFAERLSDTSDFSNSDIYGISLTSDCLKGIIVNEYQGLALSKILGIIIKE